ncbi:type IV secretion system protein [Martelella sp. HB161492]|uniref:type IV secretion system protein n=1 Tax=Martelella sp. HB161492 TaxID=2720726 RepID=UPI00158FD279|nr:type IV secretion system protein [Martelella sp. HB161492]
MGVISGFVNSAQNQLNNVAASAFGEVVSELSTTFATAATLAVVLMGVNILLQYRPMSSGAILVNLIKLIAIITIGLQWSEFNKIAMAVQGTIDSIAGTLLGNYGGQTVSSYGGLAGAMDSFLSAYKTQVNQMLAPMGWMTGAVMGALVTFSMGLLCAAVAIVLIFANIIVTIFIGVAPIFIALSMFEATKDYFYKWLHSCIHYMLYPLVIAVLLGSVLRLVIGYSDTLDASVSRSISDFIPFLTCLIILLISVIFIPTIVSALSGVIAAASPIAATFALATLGKSLLKENPIAKNSCGDTGQAPGGPTGNTPPNNTRPPDHGLALRMHERAERLAKKQRENAERQKKSFPATP